MRGKKVNDQVAVGFNVESNWCEFTEPITECSEQHNEMAEYFRHSTGNYSGQVVYLPLLVIAQHLEDIASRSKCRCYC